MQLSRAEKADLVLSVHIEMERMFGVLSHRKSPEQIAFIAEIEAAMKAFISNYEADAEISDLN